MNQIDAVATSRDNAEGCQDEPFLPKRASRVRMTLGSLRSHVTCPLCNKFFTDATTITKCLHTFCRRCVLRHLERNNTCPTCQRLIHVTRPTARLRRDWRLQQLVYKIVPGRVERYLAVALRLTSSSSISSPTMSSSPDKTSPSADASVAPIVTVISPSSPSSLASSSFSSDYSGVRSTSSPRSHPHIIAATSSANQEDNDQDLVDSSQTPQLSPLPSLSTLSHAVVSTPPLFSTRETFSISLTHCPLHERERSIWRNRRRFMSQQTMTVSKVYGKHEKEARGNAYYIDYDKSLVRYLLCPAAVTVSVLKRFLAVKYNLQPHHVVELRTGSGEFLLDSFTLVDVAYIMQWNMSTELKLLYVIAGEISRAADCRLSLSREQNIDQIEPGVNRPFYKQYQRLRKIACREQFDHKMEERLLNMQNRSAKLKPSKALPVFFAEERNEFARASHLTSESSEGLSSQSSSSSIPSSFSSSRCYSFTSSSSSTSALSNHVARAKKRKLVTTLVPLKSTSTKTSAASDTPVSQWHYHPSKSKEPSAVYHFEMATRNNSFRANQKAISKSNGNSDTDERSSNEQPVVAMKTKATPQLDMQERSNVMNDCIQNQTDGPSACYSDSSTASGDADHSGDLGTQLNVLSSIKGDHCKKGLGKKANCSLRCLEHKSSSSRKTSKETVPGANNVSFAAYKLPTKQRAFEKNGARTFKQPYISQANCSRTLDKSINGSYVLDQKAVKRHLCLKKLPCNDFSIKEKLEDKRAWKKSNKINLLSDSGYISFGEHNKDHLSVNQNKSDRAGSQKIAASAESNKRKALKSIQRKMAMNRVNARNTKHPKKQVNIGSSSKRSLACCNTISDKVPPLVQTDQETSKKMSSEMNDKLSSGYSQSLCQSQTPDIASPHHETDAFDPVSQHCLQTNGLDLPQEGVTTDSQVESINLTMYDCGIPNCEFFRFHSLMQQQSIEAAAPSVLGLLDLSKHKTSQPSSSSSSEQNAVNVGCNIIDGSFTNELRPCQESGISQLNLQLLASSVNTADVHNNQILNHSPGRRKTYAPPSAFDMAATQLLEQQPQDSIKNVIVAPCGRQSTKLGDESSASCHQYASMVSGDSAPAHRHGKILVPGRIIGQIILPPREYLQDIEFDHNRGPSVEILSRYCLDNQDMLSKNLQKNTSETGPLLSGYAMIEKKSLPAATGFASATSTFVNETLGYSTAILTSSRSLPLSTLVTPPHNISTEQHILHNMTGARRSSNDDCATVSSTVSDMSDDAVGYDFTDEDIALISHQLNSDYKHENAQCKVTHPYLLKNSSRNSCYGHCSYLTKAYSDNDPLRSTVSNIYNRTMRRKSRDEESGTRRRGNNNHPGKQEVGVQQLSIYIGHPQQQHQQQRNCKASTKCTNKDHHEVLKNVCPAFVKQTIPVDFDAARKIVGSIRPTITSRPSSILHNNEVKSTNNNSTSKNRNSNPAIKSCGIRQRAVCQHGSGVSLELLHESDAAAAALTVAVEQECQHSSSCWSSIGVVDSSLRQTQQHHSAEPGAAAEEDILCQAESIDREKSVAKLFEETSYGREGEVHCAMVKEPLEGNYSRRNKEVHSVSGAVKGGQDEGVGQGEVRSGHRVAITIKRRRLESLIDSLKKTSHPAIVGQPSPPLPVPPLVTPYQQGQPLSPTPPKVLEDILTASAAGITTCYSRSLLSVSQSQQNSQTGDTP